ncbi:MAG TPA: protein kinase [Polyangiaceae bacterium]|nr:protein kinase [Polyangiaceae bacterium]
MSRDAEPSSESLETGFARMLREVARAPSISPAELDEGGDGRDLVGRRFGPFDIVAWLGRGGMGCVYRAEDTRLRRPVALKLLPPARALDAAARERLLREARSAAAINHPRVATIYEVGEVEGVSFIAMEYVRGQTLRDWAAGRPLPPALALRQALAVAEGLAAAHARGIVHRDLKPDNVMVDADGAPKVLDFGLARPLPAADAEPAEAGPITPRPGAPFEPPFSHPGQIAGTPGYMAPEQARGEPVDARADVYAFGVLLYELLVGQRPPARVGGARGLRAALSPPARRLLDRCLEPDPSRRFADARGLVEALGRLPELRPAGGRRAWGGALVAAALLASLGLALRPAGPSGEPSAAYFERYLTANPAENPVWLLALSPAGGRLAYADQTGLSVLEIASGKRRPLALPGAKAWAESLSWFPGDEALLVEVRCEGSDDAELWRLPVGAGAPAELGRGRFRGTTLSPDGASIAFVDGEGLAWRGVNDPARRPLVAFAAGDEVKALSWSPDGRHVAFIVRSGAGEFERYTLETVDLATRARARVLDDRRLALDHDMAGLAWAPDRRILYARAELPPRPTGSNVWALPVDDDGRADGLSQRLTRWAGLGGSHFSLDASGRRLAYLRYVTQVDVYVGALRPDGRALEGAPRRLTLSDYNERASGWAPDGGAVLFTSDERGTLAPFLQPLAGGASGAPRDLGVGADHRTWPTFTADGASLLYWELSAADDGPAPVPRLVRARADGRGPAPLFTMQRATPASAVGSPPPQTQRLRCARQAPRCVVSEDEDKHVTFYEFDPAADGPLRPFLQLDVADDVGHYGWALSPDGLRLALPLRTGLHLHPVDGGPEEHHRLRPDCDLRHADWNAGGDGLFVTAVCPSDDESYQLWAAFGDEPPHRLWASSNAFLSDVIASPDGRHVAFSAKPYDNDVWLLEAP